MALRESWFGFAGPCRITCLITCLITLPLAGTASAQSSDYPSRAVTMISDAAPGSAPDIDARFT
ncbi:MAG: hypothetical protein WBE82_01110, partial [Xanthobacteraceae bacterium]